MSQVTSPDLSRRSGGRRAVRPGAAVGRRRLSKRDRRALLLGVVLLAPVLLYTLVLKPYRSAVETARSQIETQRVLLARERGLLAARERVPEVISATVQDVQRLRERLLPTADHALAEAELTAYLEDLATDNNVLLQEMRALQGRSDGPVAFAPIAVDPSYAEIENGALDPIRVTISAESDFEGIANFLNGIDGGRLLIRIVELTLEPTRASSQSRTPIPGGVRPGMMGPRAGQRGAAQSGIDQVMSLLMVIEAYAPAAPTDERTVIQ